MKTENNIKTIRISKDIHEDFMKVCGMVQKTLGIRVNANLGMRIVLDKWIDYYNKEVKQHS